MKNFFQQRISFLTEQSIDYVITHNDITHCDTVGLIVEWSLFDFDSFKICFCEQNLS